MNARVAGSILLFAAGLYPQTAPAPDAAAAPPKESGKGLPLQAERRVEYTTDEGTWMSLDVSPDGKTIVFDLVGHLYTVPVEGGKAQAITSGLSFNGQPRYSPDGRRMVFLSDRSGDNNIWIADADGSNARALTAEDNVLFSSPIWIPGGESILVSKKKPHHYNSAFEVWRYDIAGGSGVAIVKSRTSPAQTPNAAALGPALTPDGRYLYFAKKTLGAPGGGRLIPWQLMRRDLERGMEDAVTALQAGAFRPMITPDGRHLIYATRFEGSTALRVRDLESGAERWLKYPVQRDDQESASSRDLLPGWGFLPDGKEMVVSYGGKLRRLHVETGAEQVIPFEAVVARDLGPKLNFPMRVEEGPVKARVIQGATIAPNGKQAAFSALTRLYVGDLEGTGQKTLVNGKGPEYAPVWSPDGQWLAYVSWTNGDGAIWKTRADGSGTPQRLTQAPAYYRHLAWSPDGERIAALRTPPQQALTQADEWGRGLHTSDVVWIPAGGGVPTVIAGGEGFRNIHFTDRPDRLYLTLNVTQRPLSAEHELVSMRWDGSDRKSHLKVAGRDIWGADFSPVVLITASPDRRRALILFRNQLYVSSLPAIGSEVPAVDVNSPSGALVRLTTGGADEARWADGGKTIAWSVGPSLFRVPLADAEAIPAGSTEKRNTAAWARRLKPAERRFEITADRHKPQGLVVLRGARVITMRGEEVVASADVVVRDNRIVSVGPKRRAVPAGAKVIDVTGKTIVPGMIDTHAHWFEIRRGVLDPQPWDFLTTLAYGITSGRDPQTLTNDMFAYQDLVEMGAILGPRPYSTGPGIFWVSDFQSVDEAVEVVSRYKDYYRTHMVKSYMVGSRRQRQFVVEACRRLQMMPTTEGAADMELDITHSIDGFGGLEHQFPIVPLQKDLIQLVAQSGMFYTPTYVIGGYGGPGSENIFYQTTGVYKDPKVRRFVPNDIIAAKASRVMWIRPDEYVYALSAKADAQIHRSGGKICVGGHGQFQGLSFHWALWSLHAGNLTNHEALRMATLNGAEALGMAADLGSLEAGKLADLVVLRRNPLEDIRATAEVEFVMKNGELFEGDTLNQVWPKQKPLEKQWWWSERPAAQ